MTPLQSLGQVLVVFQQVFVGQQIAGALIHGVPLLGQELT
jgi:hypothetical protein